MLYGCCINAESGHCCDYIDYRQHDTDAIEIVYEYGNAVMRYPYSINFNTARLSVGGCGDYRITLTVNRAKTSQSSGQSTSLM